MYATKTLAASLASLLFPAAAAACNTDFRVTLETFGEGVTVELRSGTPGKSNVVKTTRTSGGIVSFSRLCAGTYFLAIGNEETVSVTPVRHFEDDSEYKSRITMNRGSGNVGKQSRKSL